MESNKNEKARGSIVTKVSLMTTILFVCLIVNVIASVAIQYTQIRNNVEQMLTENLSSSSVLVSNGMNNLNILVNDHSYDYQFIAGSAEDKKSHADMVASFDERVFGLTYIAADGRQYGEGVDESIKSAVFSAGKLLTTPTGEDGDFYYGLKNDMGALVSHMKAEKLATFLEGSTCDAFILSKDGTVIASHVHTGVYEKAYPNYVQSTGQTYVNTNTGGNFMNGYCYAAASIDNTDGWTVLIRAQAGQFYSGIVSAFWVNIVLVVVMSGLGAMTVLLMKKSIITPIKTIRKKIVDMSMGNISGGTVDITSNDELGELAEAVNRMTKTNEEMIVDIQHTAEQIAACNLAVQPKAEYNGDFIPIKNALESIIESLNEVVANVEAAASEVKSSSVQMSSNSSALSEAAREESQIVDELNSSLSDVHQQIKASAQKASEAREVGEQSVQAMNEGNEKMNNMLAAMEEINETSSQIANIIKTIQDISFQTNILSLNASIEAARAGTAGKGFAVVANEVGALANKTAEAAKSTTDLIETALKAVKHGTVSANETAEMLASVVEKMANSADSINQIADASVEQAQSIINVVEGVNRIAHSVEHVNISAAECASSSDVLSRESAMLYSTIENFVTDKKFERKEKKSAASAIGQTPAQPAKAPEVKPTQKPKVITLDENEEKKAASSEVAAPKAEAAPMAEAAPRAEAASKATAPKAVAPKAETAHKPAPKAKAAPTIKLEESEETPSKPQPAVSKATMAPVKHTVHLDDDKY